MCVFVQKLNLFDKGWFEKITFTSFAEQFLNICFSFSNHHYNSTICKRSSRYHSDVRNISNHHYISTICKNISTICKNICTIYKNISTTCKNKLHDLLTSQLTSPQVQWRPNPFSPSATTASSWNTLDNCTLVKIRNRKLLRVSSRVRLGFFRRAKFLAVHACSRYSWNIPKIKIDSFDCSSSDGDGESLRSCFKLKPWISLEHCSLSEREVDIQLKSIQWVLCY